MDQSLLRDIFLVGGLLFIVAVLLRILILFYSSWKESIHRDRQRQLTLELLRQQFQASTIRIADQEQHQASWNGYRKFVVQNIIQENDSISSFFLYPHDKKTLPSFHPGQHLTFQLYIPGRDKPLIRCYSLSKGPTQSEWYRVSIKKIPAPSDKPDILPGLASSFFHHQIQEGDILDVKAPSGKFFLDINGNSPVVFLAGGVGITPFLSMVDTITAKKLKREFWLFYGVKNQLEQIMEKYLRDLNTQFPNMHLYICHSRPISVDPQEKKYDHQGIISINLLQQHLPSNNFEFYLCGPPPMMNSLVDGLKEWGVPDSKLFFEAFGPASVQKHPTRQWAQPDAQGIEIRFSKSRKTILWDATIGNLLEFAEKEGISINYGCRSGSCGTCLTAIKSGEVLYHTEPGEKPESGSCLPCISIPKGNITLDA